MLLRSFDAHPGHEITPRADNARHEALLHQIEQAFIRRIEVFGPDARVIGLPRVACLVRAARIEREHVGIKPGDDLNDIEPFFLTVSRKLLEFIRKMQAMAQSHPPGVAEPEEWRAVGVFEKSFVGSHAYRAMHVERILAGVWFDLNAADDVMKTLVTRIRAFTVESMRPGDGRRIARLPEIGSGPECRHTKFAALWVNEDHVE